MLTRRELPKTKVLVLSSRIGGHSNASLSIAEALERLKGDEISTEIIDIHRKPYLRFPASLLAGVYEPLIRMFPRLWGAVFHLGDRPILFEALSLLARMFCNRAAFETLAMKRPGVVVSTIFMHSQTRLLRAILSATGDTVPFMTVVIDPITVHYGWVAFNADQFIVSTQASQDTCVRRFGIPRDRVLRFGFPVRPKFIEMPDKQRLRQELGLDAGAFSVLFVGGAAGAGRIGEFVREVYDARLGVQLLVVCGHNESLRRRLQRQLDPRIARVWGFVDNLEVLMNAADVVVTKAGPNTVTEALACNRPVLLTGEIPGQEKGNIDYYERLGVAASIATPADLVNKLKQFLGTENSQLRELKINVQQVGNPNGAMDIAAAIVSLLEQGKPTSARSSGLESVSP